MYQSCVLQYCEGVQQLRREDLHELCAEPLELVLLDKLVEIRRKQLEHETQVILVDEGVPQPQNVMLVVRIALVVQLKRPSDQYVCEVNVAVYARARG